MAIVYVGLGSNLDNPAKQIRQAVKTIAEHEGIHLLSNSGLFSSAALTWHNEPQPDYMNAVIKFETAMTPHKLLDTLQAIENSQGRVRNQKWGARTLDLDILLYDQLELNDERLTIPHPEITQRAFVLYPLNSIDKNLQIPGFGYLADLLNKVSMDDVKFSGEMQ
ncbi:MAG: 2-amino-4-hydroxy-6-hydroxymethyldihydropteridine diphosphokinase [Gammaproteobacteria bacterium]|nr:2-amino-4-hydroxy-6-hydroxymethyldihydropteridine diphosphokinase [Gammaproteobacteria bacterium]